MHNMKRGLSLADEFDTKFNFLNERRRNRRQYSLDSIVEQSDAEGGGGAADLCGAALCWRRAAAAPHRSISIVTTPAQTKRSCQQQHSGNSGSAKSARQIKGQLLGIGIGTRTGSMKSMKSTHAGFVGSAPGASVPANKESIQMKSTLLISGDIVCVLSCILLTAICPLFMGLIRLPLLWAVSRLDVLTFGFTAMATILLSDLSQALFYSVIFALSTIVIRAQWPRLQQLVNVTGSGVYYAERCYYGSDLMDESGVSVIRYEAPILFHNAKHFKLSVLESARQIKGWPNYDNLIAAPSLESGAIIKVLIIDLSSVPYLDAQAITVMRELLCGAFEHVPKHYFFPSVHDAVLCAQQMGGFIAPSIHMSVSLNGCRDLITLSNAASNHDIYLNTETSGQISSVVPHPEVASLGPSAAGSSSSPFFATRPISSPTTIGGSADLTSLHHHRTSHPTGPTSRGMSSWAKIPLKKSNS
uniref:STAS domain-containing protein n=1 Tax=Globodera pallida TaxID=36090 RepID=A0A183CJ19_GLOPA